MIKRRIAAPAFSLAAALLAACGHAPVESAASKATAAPAAAGPDGILALDKQLMADHRSLFSLTKNRYSYYIGGVLMADYGVDTGVLRVRSLRPNHGDLACEYGPRGELFIDAAAHPDAQSYGADCTRLVQSLRADLAR